MRRVGESVETRHGFPISQNLQDFEVQLLHFLVVMYHDTMKITPTLLRIWLLAFESFEIFDMSGLRNLGNLRHKPSRKVCIFFEWKLHCRA